MKVTTQHSFDRSKERQKIKNRRTAERNISLAIQRGKRADDYSSWERDYLRKEARGKCAALVYNNSCYIISEDGVCVTLFRLPRWFGKKKHFDGKERIRSYKKYCKNNLDFTDKNCALFWQSTARYF